VRRDGDDDSSLLYDEVLTRSYRNSAGEVVMLSIAYGRRQRQEMKIHRPELCYAAQGFEVGRQWPVDLTVDGRSGSFPGRTMLATSSDRTEQVMYWVRVGDVVSTTAWRTRSYILIEGVAGRTPDGVLVRASQVVQPGGSPEASVALLRRFAAQLHQAVPVTMRRHLLPDGQS
jgi:EpsI family protein